MAEPTYRMSMLPFGTYANPDGTESLGLAMPGMIQEPINALMRLAENSRFPDGRLGIPNPDNAQNREDVLTGLLSMYGGNAMNPAAAIPKGALASGALREAPQRMYHGTAAAEDFSMFRPSDSGSFGPGVYLSNDAAHAGSYAGLDDGARVMPLDVSGPFASMDDYLTTLHANGRNHNAALRALQEQGFTGVSGDVGGPGFSNVTNVFKPGSVKSATTGETLFSDTGKPSLMGSAIAGAKHNLPMDEASRLARAREMGFDTDKVLYRGQTNADREPNAASHGEIGPGVYVTKSPSVAQEYARNGYGGEYPQGAGVLDLYSKKLADVSRDDWLGQRLKIMKDLETKNGGNWDSAFVDQAHDALRKQYEDAGYYGVYLKGERGSYDDQGVIFNPSDIRSPRAAFDPANVGKNGLLLSDTGRPSLFGSAQSGAQSDEDQRNALLRHLITY